MKTLPKRLLFLTFLSLLILSLTALISCEDYLPVTGETDNGGTDPGGTNPGGTNPSSSLASQLEWLKNNALTGSSHVIVVTANETIAPQNYLFNGRNITLTLKGDGVNRTITLSSPDSMFIIRGNTTLILDSNITLRGISGNTRPVVLIEGNGTFIMNAGSTITSNGHYGVEVWSDFGRFTMNGGTISGNTSNVGAGLGWGYW